MKQEKVYKGIDLLDLIIDFKAMTPDNGYWTQENIMRHPPTRIRFLRIQALIKAFLIPPSLPPAVPSEKPKDPVEYSINDVENGAFLDSRSARDFEEVSELVKSYLRERDHSFAEPVREHDYRWFRFSFVSLFRYKAKLNALLSPGIQECTPHFSAIISVHLTDDIGDKIKNVGKELNEILELLANPNKLQFAEPELIARFGFPSEDLYSIDGDYD